MAEHRLLLDPADDPAAARRVYAQTRLASGVVMVLPTPGRGGEGIGRDVLRALGKRFGLRGSVRDPAKLLALASQWLSAHLTVTLIVRHGEQLAPQTWHDLIRTAPDNCHVWFWADSTRLLDGHHVVARRLGLRPASFEELHQWLSCFERNTPPIVAVAMRPSTAGAPDLDYATFALAVRQPGNEGLRANFTLGCDHARWFLHNVTYRPSLERVGGLLDAVAHCAIDTEAAIARVRGAQLQLLVAGIHTSIDPGKVRERLSMREFSSPDEHAARLLTAYLQPLPAATAAACLTSGLGPGWLASLAPTEITAERVGDYRVPKSLWPLTRALSSAVLTDHRQPLLEPRRIRAAHDAIADQTGLRFNRTITKRSMESRWMEGISLR